ncbi:hypothetical protein ACFL54_06080 [Planctomycetota bacterium]
MKIIAESTVPSKTPVLHLGYIASTSYKANDGLIMTGLVLILAGIALSVRVTFGKTLKGKIGIFFHPHKRISWSIIALIFILAGSFTIYCGRKFGETRFDHPVGMSYSRAMHLFMLIDKSIEDDNPIPETLFAMKSEWDLQQEDLYDGWLTPFQIHKEVKGGITEYTIVSAGKDGQFETPDDIICPSERTRKSFSK